MLLLYTYLSLKLLVVKTPSLEHFDLNISWNLSWVYICSLFCWQRYEQAWITNNKLSYKIYLHFCLALGISRWQHLINYSWNQPLPTLVIQRRTNSLTNENYRVATIVWNVERVKLFLFELYAKQMIVRILSLRVLLHANLWSGWATFRTYVTISFA